MKKIILASFQFFFFLALCTALSCLETEMKKLITGFVFDYCSGDHFTLFSPVYRSAGDHFLIENYLQ